MMINLLEAIFKKVNIPLKLLNKFLRFLRVLETSSKALILKSKANLYIIFKIKTK